MTNRWIRGLTMAVTLLSCNCRATRKEPFEKVPLAPDQIEVVSLSQEPNLFIERIRFWSKEMNEPRYFLALIPKTPARTSTYTALQPMTYTS